MLRRCAQAHLGCMLRQVGRGSRNRHTLPVVGDCRRDQLNLASAWMLRSTIRYLGTENQMWSWHTSTSVIIWRAATCGWAKVCSMLLIGPNGTLDNDE